MISKTHTSAQKPRGRQLNTKVCSYKSAIFLLSFFLCSDQSGVHSSSGSRLYQRDVIRVPLSMQTYDSVVKTHGMVLASSKGNLWYIIGRLPCTV